MKRALLVVAVLACAVILVAVTGVPSPKPNPPGTFSFAVMGDAPYYWHEDLRFRILLRSLDEHDLAVVISLGDIFWKPCSDAMYEKFRDRFDALRHPVVYTPGDNEWVDCWEPRVGGYVPLERLRRLRQIFYDHPTRSRGAKPIALESQGGEFVENARWRHGDFVFATMHLPGSWNATKAFPRRSPADDAETKRRMEADVAWLRETFAAATNAKAVVVVFHASTSLERPRGHEWRRVYEPFIAALEEESVRFGKPVLAIHGDDHEYIVDRPLPHVPNLTRMEVPGSYDVGWVRVTVDPRAANPFTFEKHIVPKWKWW